MRFKEFLITERMGIIASDLGVVLTSLQEYLNVLNDLALLISLNLEFSHELW